MNVLSLFDGISCGQIALNRAGIKYDNYFASEVDKHAIKVTQHNYPNTIQLGDVRNVHAKDLPKIDLLIGGSPCQGFSFAGKQLNFEDPRSKLFFEYVRLKNETNPNYFFLENVIMKKEYKNVISDYINCCPIEINSSLVSAQNRRRLYWTNIYHNQLKDRGIFINEILQKHVDYKYYLSEKATKYITRDDRIKKKFTSISGNKSLPLMSQYNISKNGTFVIDANARVSDKKTGTLGARYYKGIEQFGGNPFILEPGDKVRKLTPIECERLQTVPDNYTGFISDSQRYRCLGNGWTVDVIAHIFKGLTHPPNNKPFYTQTKLL